MSASKHEELILLPCPLEKYLGSHTPSLLPENNTLKICAIIKRSSILW
jgi:hypothetical protein